jgi:hypothetical protein
MSLRARSLRAFEFLSAILSPRPFEMNFRGHGILGKRFPCEATSGSAAP